MPGSNYGLPNLANLSRLERQINSALKPTQAASGFGTSAVANSLQKRNPGIQARTAANRSASPVANPVASYNSSINDARMRSAQAASQAQAGRVLADRASQQAKPTGTGFERLQSSQPQSGGAEYTSNTVDDNNPRGQVVKAAMSLIGTPYAWGGGGYGNKGSRGTGKGTQNVIGVDCSGLVAYAYGAIGLKLPHFSQAQLSMGYRTSMDKAQPGDLVGWAEPGGGVKRHVAVYIGNGMMVEAPQPGGRVQQRPVRGNAFAVHLNY